MKTEKLSLNSIKNVLSRAEMRNIMAGSGGGGSGYCTPQGSMCGTDPLGHTYPCCNGGACGHPIHSNPWDPTICF